MPTAQPMVPMPLERRRPKPHTVTSISSVTPVVRRRVKPHAAVAVSVPRHAPNSGEAATVP